MQDGGVDDERERKMAFGKVLGGEFNLTVAAVRCWKLPGGDLHVGGCDVMAVSLVTGGAGSRSYCSDLGALFRDTQFVPIRGRPIKGEVNKAHLCLSWSADRGRRNFF